MPPSKRRRTAGPAVSGANQSTLSFRSSKAGTNQATSKTTGLSKASQVKAHKECDEEIEASVIEPAVSEENFLSKENEDTHEVLDEVTNPEPEDVEAFEREELNKKARGLPESKIKSYWMEKEQERKAPRVHQEDLSVREKILREFDMTSRYGPSIGVSRIARWHRACRLGLNPPIEALAVLLKEEEAAGRGKTNAKRDVQKSISDSLLLSSRGNEVEA